MGWPNLIMLSVRTSSTRTGMKFQGLEVGVPSPATLERRRAPLKPREGTMLALCLHSEARLKKRELNLEKMEPISSPDC